MSASLGAFEFADNGDPTISLFDIFEYQGGKLARAEAGRRQEVSRRAEGR